MMNPDCGSLQSGIQGRQKAGGCSKTSDKAEHVKVVTTVLLSMSAGSSLMTRWGSSDALKKIKSPMCIGMIIPRVGR